MTETHISADASSEKSSSLSFEPTQTLFEVDAEGSAVARSLSYTEEWGPGQGYPFAWDAFTTPRSKPRGTSRTVRHQWRSGGVLQQLGTAGDFGPQAFSQAGWIRRHFSLGLGRHDFAVTFRMGPVTERPSGRYARGQVFALLRSNLPGSVRYASAELPSSGVVSLNLDTLLPGPGYSLAVGCIGWLYEAGRQPYCEVIVNDIKVRHTVSRGAATGDAQHQRGAVTQTVPDALEIPSLDPALLFEGDSVLASSMEAPGAGGAAPGEWVTLDEV